MAERKKEAKDGFGPAIEKIEKKIGYTFKDKSLLRQAFTRTSFCNENNNRTSRKYQSNEVLEFFGDGVLSVAIISYLMNTMTQRYEGGIKTELGEGDFSNIKSKLSDKKNLSEATKSLGLQKYLRMGEGDSKLNIENEPSVMEDLFESIVGAIYIDCDMDMKKVTKIVSGMLDIALYTKAAPPIQSAKNALQEWCQDKKRRLPVPTYKTIKKTGPDHKPTYEQGCYINDELIAIGIGKNEKLAEKAAAEAALQKLMEKESEKAKPKASNPEKRAKQTRATTANTGTKKQQKGKALPQNKNTTEAFDEEIESKEFSLKLRKFAKSKKILGPSFIDLGPDAKNSEHRVECRFNGTSKIGTSLTREGAKESAAKKMYTSLGSLKNKK